MPPRRSSLSSFTLVAVVSIGRIGVLGPISTSLVLVDAAYFVFFGLSSICVLI
jgi:hypothetical protein